MWMRTKKSSQNCGNVSQNEALCNAHETTSPVNAGDGCALVGLLLTCDTKSARMKPEMSACKMGNKFVV